VPASVCCLDHIRTSSSHIFGTTLQHLQRSYSNHPPYFDQGSPCPSRVHHAAQRHRSSRSSSRRSTPPAR
jgi:hypothetical protein